MKTKYISGIAAGSGALVATSIVTTAIRFFFGSVSLYRPLRVGGTLEIYAWAFYSAHLVGMRGPNNGVFGGKFLIFEPVTVGLPPIVYLVVPPLVLFIAGYVVVARADQITRPLQVFTLIGVMGVTYAFFPFIGSFFVRVAFDRGLLMTPDPGYIVLNMGIVYPLLFGGYGGLLAYALRP